MKSSAKQEMDKEADGRYPSSHSRSQDAPLAMVLLHPPISMFDNSAGLVHGFGSQVPTTELKSPAKQVMSMSPTGEYLSSHVRVQLLLLGVAARQLEVDSGAGRDGGAQGSGLHTPTMALNVLARQEMLIDPCDEYPSMQASVHDIPDGVSPVQPAGTMKRGARESDDWLHGSGRHAPVIGAIVPAKHERSSDPDCVYPPTQSSSHDAPEAIVAPQFPTFAPTGSVVDISQGFSVQVAERTVTRSQ